MRAFETAFIAVWVVFWVYWLVAAAGAKPGTRRGPARAPGLVFVVLAFVLARLTRSDSLEIHSTILDALGTVLLASGLALAVWARRSLGRNWGMPMSRKEDPELVTSGPYRLVRHPIYSGILLAMLGTALVANVSWLIILAVAFAYFIYSARVEERILAEAFPAAYPAYRARTKMLVPFLL